MTEIPGESFTIGELEAGPKCCDPVPEFTIRNLGVSYRGKTVLEDVSLDIYKGCVTALIGPSGCGKTTFLSVLNRMTDLFEGASITGSVKLGTENIFAPSVDVQNLRRRVGMIFQKPNPFPLSVYKNLDLPMRELGVRDKDVRARKIERALKDVGLWEEVKDRLHTPASALSGGQQQRLCIARAIVLEPEILLMDEPCSALDPFSSRVVEELVCSLRGRFTVVIVTHNLAQARRIGNYAAFFWMNERAGKLVEFGRCRQIFDQPQSELTRAYVAGLSG